MLKQSDLRPGNIILFDHNDRRRPANPLLRGIVIEALQDKVLLKGDIKLGYDRLAGLPIDVDLLEKFGFKKDEYGLVKLPLRFCHDGDFCIGKHVFDQPEYFHDLQNIYQDQTGEKLEITVPEPPPIHPQQ